MIWFGFITHLALLPPPPPFSLCIHLSPLTVFVQVFYDATTFISRRGTPTLPMVIPIMDHLDEVLTNNSLDDELEPAICAACRMGKKVLNKYYDRTDHSEMYRISMSALTIHASCSILIYFVAIVLHPAYKLEYFRNANWQPQWIQAAEDTVREEYERKYTAFDEAQADEDDDVMVVDNPRTVRHVLRSLHCVFSLSV